jgi:hypothetical protein
LEDFADQVIDTLRETVIITNGQLVNGYKIHQAIDATLTGDDTKSARSKLKANTKYTISQVVRGIRLAKFEALCKFSGENDMFILLPHRKLTICIEVIDTLRETEVITSRDCISIYIIFKMSKYILYRCLKDVTITQLNSINF